MGDEDGVMVADLDDGDEDPGFSDDDMVGDEAAGAGSSAGAQAEALEEDVQEAVPDLAWQRLCGHADAVYAVAVR